MTQIGTFGLNSTEGHKSLRVFRNDSYDSEKYDCQKESYEWVMIILTLCLWTFITLYVIIFLIYYLRRLQYFQLYDKCQPRNAHFRYDFHIMVGKHSINFNRFDSMIILDLLDNQLVSTMTIQVPATTIFNDNQIFLYKHPQLNLHCVKFSVFRRQPLKDVKSLRVAHNCSQNDSRIYIYALNLYDSANKENKFFPLSSVVKYRGTQWALQTTFEPKNDVDFQQLGASCYDPFCYSNWPTLLEVLTLLLYIWAASFCFGHLISVNEVNSSLTLHALTILFITGSSAAVISFIYLYFIKSHIVDLHYDSIWWELAQFFNLGFVFTVSINLWILSLSQTKGCWDETKDWIMSTISVASSLSACFLIAYLIADRRRHSRDSQALEETDAALTKTNSKPQLELYTEPSVGLFGICCQQQGTSSNIEKRDAQVVHVAKKTGHNVKSGSRGAPAIKRATGGSGSKSKETSSQKTAESGKKDDSNLETVQRYIKTKNRNSISQYV